MKKTFTDEQIVGILRGFEASGKTIKEYCREKGFERRNILQMAQSFWDDGSLGDQRIPAVAAGKLPFETPACRTRFGNRCDERGAGKKVVTVAARREVVAFIKTRNISERRGCRLVSLNRKSCRYQKRRRMDDALLNRMCGLALEHPRFGYRRIHALLKREDFKVNLKCVYRLWRQQNLSLPKKRPRKIRAAEGIGIVSQATGVNQIWTYDFVFDQSLSGKSLKMLTLIDEFTQDVFGGRGWRFN